MKLIHKEEGLYSVEAALCMALFAAFYVSLISLVTVVHAESSVQYALDKTAIDFSRMCCLSEDSGSSAEERRVEVVAADHPDAMRALSLVKVLGRFQFAMPEGDAIPVSLLAVTIKTGRTHQIRVHLSYKHLPIVGDQVYGGRPRFPAGASEALRNTVQQFPRQALHATRLGLHHPMTGEALAWEVPMPADMSSLLETLRQAAAV